VVSITDGQIYLQSDLFFSGQRPAVNVGISVSRVGGAAQTKAMKKVAGSLRINLAQYRELEVFAQFGSDLDKATQAQLSRGKRMMETLKQPVNAPMPVEDQVILLFAVSDDSTEEIPAEHIKSFNERFLRYVKDKYPSVPQNIAETGELSAESEKLLLQAAGEFAAKWNQ